jgi:hypothetical protein
LQIISIHLKFLKLHSVGGKEGLSETPATSWATRIIRHHKRQLEAEEKEKKKQASTQI